MTTSSLASSPRQPIGPDFRLRELQASDRHTLDRLLQRTGVFTPDEVAVALELIDIGHQESRDGYHFVVAELGGQVVGYACYGHTPCTDAVYDLYWIAVDPDLHGQGVGKRLLGAVESDVWRSGGRMVLIETASRAEYDGTRSFYLRTKYVEVARVPDFYRIGDDKVIYARRLG